MPDVAGPVSGDRPVLFVKRCARCGNDHPDVEFARLERSLEGVSPRLTHWAPCPANGEPILMAILAKHKA